MKENNQVLVKDIERLGKTYLISESDVNRVRRLQADISALNATIEEMTHAESEVSEAYSVLQERLENLQSTLKDIEDNQIGVSERLVKLKKMTSMLVKKQMYMSTVCIRLNATWRREIFQEFHKNS